MTIQGKDPLSELVKIYPLYLHEVLENPSPLISLKSETRLELKTDPKAALKMYLEYYNLSLQTPSPLHPKLADAFLKKDAKTLISRLKTLSHDPYIETVFKGADPQVVFDTWSPTLRKTFAPMLEMLDDKV
jgi:hypothetical protein